MHTWRHLCKCPPSSGVSPSLLAAGEAVSQAVSQGTAGAALSQGAGPVSSAGGAPVHAAEPARTSSNSSQSQDEILKGPLGDTQARVLRKAEQNKRAQQRHRQKQKVGSCWLAARGSACLEASKDCAVASFAVRVCVA